ncbi:MAG: endonuclease/exonuclease/phosphatase family protein [Betaproteobacteria bacterium]|jgi:endonuclease/exonuclease/phosphatase family metal-dependent hydrolase|nr:endonuclease/exonuclease/phosphatase family protein [Betaproteobacteria bacterium]
MKVLQWNIQWCRGMDGAVDPARIARVAQELADPDIACFQEVAVNFPALEGSSGEDQVALLSAHFPGYSAHFVSGADMPDDTGGRRLFGNLLLTRYPVQQVFRHSLPRPAEDAVPCTPRAAIEAVIDTPLGALRVTTTHLEYYSQMQRSAQVARLREVHAEACGYARARPSSRESGPFQPLPRPASAILTADFNMRIEDPAYAALLAPFADHTPRLFDAWTHAHPGTPHSPSFCLFDDRYAKLPYCCDFVFVTEDLLPRIKAIRIDQDTRASDHQPVIVEFD